MKYLEKIDYLSKIKKIEKIMSYETNKLKKFTFVKEIRGIGFMWGIEINNNYFSKKDFTNTIRSKLLRNYLITWESGIDSNVICLVPPITISISSIKNHFQDFIVQRVCISERKITPLISQPRCKALKKEIRYFRSDNRTSEVSKTLNLLSLQCNRSR